jgi:hypothetical protein
MHIEDAAAATAVAVERGRPGVYLGAKPPRHVPRWLGRLLAGEMATIMMTEVKGASNEKAKRELGWKPRYASWRQGFAQGLG